jgi:hypothetical protein
MQLREKYLNFLSGVDSAESEGGRLGLRLRGWVFVTKRRGRPPLFGLGRGADAHYQQQGRPVRPASLTTAPPRWVSGESAVLTVVDL